MGVLFPGVDYFSRLTVPWAPCAGCMDQRLPVVSAGSRPSPSACTGARGPLCTCSPQFTSSSFSVTWRGLDVGLLRPLGPTSQNSDVFRFHRRTSRVGVWVEPLSGGHITMLDPCEEDVAV